MMNHESRMHLCYEKCTGTLFVGYIGSMHSQTTHSIPQKNILDRAIIHHKDPTISLIHIFSSNLETHSSVSE